MSAGNIRSFLVGDAQADRMVPPSGITASLTIFVSAAMAFLAVFALAMAMASSRLADRWAEELARSATLRIIAPTEDMAAMTEAALTILEQTPGIASARALDDAEQAALLEPWFGPDFPMGALPVPQLIEVTAEARGYDIDGLRLRLNGEVPGAVLDDHSHWRTPLVSAADSLRRLGWLSILLIAGSMAAMITLAANASLAANAQVIDVLRLVGARDRYIAHAFMRRFSLRALIGAAAGTVIGTFAIALLPEASETGGFLTGLGFQGLGWAVPLLIPLFAAAIALLATWAAAGRRLETPT